MCVDAFLFKPVPVVLAAAFSGALGRAGVTWWPVIMQRQFQQFVEFFVPLVQFLDRMMDIPAACRSWYAQYIPVQQTVEISQVQFWVVVDAPVVCNDRCPGWVVQ